LSDWLKITRAIVAGMTTIDAPRSRLQRKPAREGVIVSDTSLKMMKT
jgi:hypothetical protein